MGYLVMMRTIKTYPEQDQLNELFTLAPDTQTGLRWRIKPRRGVHIGDMAGATFGKYAAVQINKVLYMAHRIVWIMVNGSIPDGMLIDHIDGNKKNNAIHNLRLSTNGSNQMNMPAKSTSRTGVRGLSIRTFSDRGAYYNYAIQVSDLQGRKHNNSFTLDVGLEYVLQHITAMKRELHGDFYKEEVHDADTVRALIKANYGIDV